MSSSNIVISGIAAITTIQLFDGWDGLSDVLHDVGQLACWVHRQMPENRFARTTLYTLGGLVVLRSLPFILRRTSFFQYYEQEMLYFHRTNNNRDVLSMKHELLAELKDLDFSGNDESVNGSTENLDSSGNNDTHKVNGAENTYNHETITKIATTRFPLLPNGRFTILELNIGAGTNSSYYPKGAVVIGTDFLEDEKEAIQNNFMFKDDNDEDDKESLTLDRYIHTRVEELKSVPDNSISCVVSFHALCSARKTDRALNEILRVLMPGGRLYFIEHTTEKSWLSYMWWAQLNFSISLFMLACCLKKIEAFIENAGFSKVSIKRKDIDLSRSRGPVISLTPHVYGYAVK